MPEWLTPEIITLLTTKGAVFLGGLAYYIRKRAKAKFAKKITDKDIEKYVKKTKKQYWHLIKQGFIDGFISNSRKEKTKRRAEKAKN